MNSSSAKIELLLREAMQRLKDEQTDTGEQYDTPDGIVRFVRERLGASPASYQEEILQTLVKFGRVAVRSPHGGGKTTVSAWVVLWAMNALPGETKILVTASVWRQVKRYTFPEVKKWLYQSDLPRPRVLDTELKATGKSAFGASSDDPYNLEGLHAENVVVIMDEAKAIPDAYFDALEGALSTGNTFALMISTPGEASGRFYDIFKRKPGLEDWKTIAITLEDAIAAGRVDPEWAEQRRLQWGEHSSVYLNRVRGEFAEVAEDAVIPLSWVEQAVERWHARHGRGAGDPVFGVDVARYGVDKTVIVRLRGPVVEAIDEMSQADTMQTTGKVTALAKREHQIAVDVIGIGAGVADRLREMGYNAMGVNVATSTTRTDATGHLHFVNLRSALWWGLRDELDPTNPTAMAIPPHDGLIGDLTAPRWTYTSNGKIKIESKDDIRKRLGRSTDYADALAMALYALRPETRVPGMLVKATLGGRRERSRDVRSWDYWFGDDDW